MDWRKILKDSFTIYTIHCIGYEIKWSYSDHIWDPPYRHYREIFHSNKCRNLLLIWSHWDVNLLGRREILMLNIPPIYCLNNLFNYFLVLLSMNFTRMKNQYLNANGNILWFLTQKISSSFSLWNSRKKSFFSNDVLRKKSVVWSSVRATQFKGLGSLENERREEWNQIHSISLLSLCS